jgi:hypothetical protein
MPSEPKLRTLELTEFERIVPRGVQKQTWTVCLDGRWVCAMKVPGAEVVQHPGQAGVVWQRCIRVQLQPGAQLRSTTESPQAAKRQDVFSIMTIDARSPTRVQRLEFRVTAKGTLDRSKPT